MEFVKVLLLALNVDKRAVTALEYGMIASPDRRRRGHRWITGLGTKLNTVLSSVSSAL